MQQCVNMCTMHMMMMMMMILLTFFALTFFFALVFSCEWRCRQRCGSLQYLRGSNLQSNRTATVVTWIPTA